MIDSRATPHTDLDRELLDGIRAGNEESLALFDARFRTRLLYAAQRRGIGRDDAEDIVQETLLAAIVQITDRQFEERASLGAWVWAIFLRRMADRVRKAVRYDKTFVPLPPDGLSPAGALVRRSEAHLEHEELRQEVRQALGALPARERLVLLMNVQGELPAREIARILKLGTKTTEAALTTAKKQFARLWSRRGIGWNAPTKE